MEYLHYICIECPRGCELTVTAEDGKVDVRGNACPRGKAYAEAEAVCPRRILTSTVRADGGMVPVKTDRAVAKAQMLSLMKKIRAFHLQHDVRAGDVIVHDLDGEGANLIATSDYCMHSSAASRR